MSSLSLSYVELGALITARPLRGQTFLASIDGPGGAGKSTVAHALAAACQWRLVQVDDFYKPSAERALGTAGVRPLGVDFDLARLERQVLEPLFHGRAARYQRYDWERDALGESVELLPGDVVLVEGVYSGMACYRARYACRVWVECSRETRLRRGLARDGEAARARWANEWMPEEDRYIAAESPQLGADFMVIGDDRDGPERGSRVVIAADPAGCV